MTTLKKAVQATGALAVALGLAVTAWAVSVTVPGVVGVSTDQVVGLPRINAAGNAAATSDPAANSVVVVNVISDTYVVTASGKTRNATNAPHRAVTLPNNANVATEVQDEVNALRNVVDGNAASNAPKSRYLVFKRPNPAAPAATDALAILTATGTLP